MIKHVFIGSSVYALPALELLCKKGMPPLLVISQPDKPAGRNLRSTPTPVARYALDKSLPLIRPADINLHVEEIASLQPDILITASYGGFIGKKLRHLAPGKAINLHPSLLPRYRGASPIQCALLAGEKTSGNTIFRLSATMDAGPIIAQESLEIRENENYSSLQQRLADQAAGMLLSLLQNNPLPFAELAQDAALATLCPKIDSSLCQISWKSPALAIQNKIRAFSLEPGAWTYLRGSKLKLLEAIALAEKPSGECGTVASVIKNKGFTVNCLDSQLQILLVQAAGKKIMEASAFVNGARLIPGEKLWM